jgi:hypothetical protein
VILPGEEISMCSIFRSLLAPLAMVMAFVAAPCAAVEWKPASAPLMTRWGKEVTPENAWREYPRPQLVREAWLNLNGLWEYAIVDRPAGESGVPTADGMPPRAWDGQILVPFAPESALSGVGKSVSKEQVLWYRRSVTVPEAWKGKRVMLRFDAVDWHSSVWINGKKLGDHSGGSDPYAYDVTAHLRAGDNEILLRAWDPSDEGPQPRGKQKLKPEGIWYTPVSGIWQTVWLEPLPDQAIERLKLTPDADAGTMTIEPRLYAPGDGYTLRASALAGGQTVASGEGPASAPLRRVLGSASITFTLYPATCRKTQATRQRAAAA